MALQSTSPDDLYRKKIDDAEYGEAVMLARHYGLDCDPVYERQWRLSDHSTNAVADYLSKISDVSVVVAECSAVIPETAEAMEGLLKFGIRTVGDSDPASREKFQVYLKRLAIYQEVVDARNADSQRTPEESRFEAAEFSRFRDVPLLDSAKTYAAATVPDVAAVSAMMHSRDAASEMAAHALSIIASFPEYLDPSWYCHLLTAVASSERFQTFGKREELRLWFEGRAADIEERTGIAENALKLCDIGLDLGLR